MNYNSCLCGMKIYPNLNSKENEKIEFFSQVTYDFQTLGNETLIAAGYKDIKFLFFTS